MYVCMHVVMYILDCVGVLYSVFIVFECVCMCTFLLMAMGIDVVPLVAVLLFCLKEVDIS